MKFCTASSCLAGFSGFGATGPGRHLHRWLRPHSASRTHHAQTRIPIGRHVSREPADTAHWSRRHEREIWKQAHCAMMSIELGEFMCTQAQKEKKSPRGKGVKKKNKRVLSENGEEVQIVLWRFFRWKSPEKDKAKNEENRSEFIYMIVDRYICIKGTLLKLYCPSFQLFVLTTACSWLYFS